MKEAEKSPFRLNNFFIKESKFLFSEKGEDLDLTIRIRPRGKVFKQENTFVLELSLELSQEGEGIEINVVGIATYKFKEDLEGELPSSYFITNAPAIAFPYLRAYISCLSAQSGFNTITLPVLNLTPLAEELRNNIEIVE